MTNTKADKLIAALERQGQRLDRMEKRWAADGQELREMRLELREIRDESESMELETTESGEVVQTA